MYDVRRVYGVSSSVSNIEVASIIRVVAGKRIVYLTGFDTVSTVSYRAKKKLGPDPYFLSYYFFLSAGPRGPNNTTTSTYWYFETKRYLGFFLPADFAENLTADSVWHKTATL